MDEMVFGGIIAILSALPGIVIGLALLMGKWRPASPVINTGTLYS